MTAASTPGPLYPVRINVLRNDRALVGRLDPSTVTIVAPPLRGLAWANPDGSVTYWPASKVSSAVDRFQYTVRDDRGLGSNVATVTMLADEAHEQACWSTTRGQVLKGRLPVSVSEADGPILYRLAAGARAGTVTITDPTTGRFAYTPSGGIPEAADAFAYEVVGAAGHRRHVATIIPRPRIMILGRAPATGAIGREIASSWRLGFRQSLQALLRADGYNADFVGSQAVGTDARSFDTDTEVHAGLTAMELAYGKAGDGSDGIYAWLTANSADVVLLPMGPALARGGIYGVEAILDEIDRWAASPGGNPVSVVVASLIGAGANGDALHQAMITMIAGRAASGIPASDVILINHHVAHSGDFRDRLRPNAAGYGYRDTAQIWHETLVENGLLDKCPQ